jgi:hypothetical protein
MFSFEEAIELILVPVNSRYRGWHSANRKFAQKPNGVGVGYVARNSNCEAPVAAMILAPRFVG